MPDSKIAGLTEDTTPDPTDVVYATDAGGTVDKRVPVGSLTAAEAAARAAADVALDARVDALESSPPGGVTLAQLNEAIAALAAQISSHVVSADPNVARPPGFAVVTFHTPTEPTNAQPGDVWLAYTPPEPPGSLSETDTVGLVDAVTTVAGYVRDQVDAVGVSDSISVEHQSLGEVALTDPLAVSDFVAAVVGYVREQTDAVGVSDSITVEHTGPAAVTGSLVYEENLTTDGTVFTTTSNVAVPAGQVSLLAIDTKAVNITPPTITQTGVTWELVVTSASTATAASIHLYRCAPGSAANAPITATFTGTKTFCTMTVVTAPNSNPGNNGADAIGSTDTTEQGSGTPIAATLDPIAGPSSAVFGFLYQDGTGVPTVGTGFTLLGAVAGTAPANRTRSEWRNNVTAPATVDFTTVSGVTRLVAVEVKAL